MPKTTPRKSITSRVPSSIKGWWRWLTSRERQAASQFLGCLGMVSSGAALLAATLYLAGHPYEISGADNVIIVIILISIFLWYFIFIFLLSFLPGTRKWADKTFHFRDLTELEELKVRVDTIEKVMLSRNKRVAKELKGIKSRLGSIEATLEKLAGKENKRDNDG
jgi:hypothetical protein